MSADSWTYCPKCQPEGDLENDELYGNQHLREDYEQGMSQDGKYFVFYRCSCQNCGFIWKYQHEERVVPNHHQRQEQPQ